MDISEISKSKDMLFYNDTYLGEANNFLLKWKRKTKSCELAFQNPNGHNLSSKPFLFFPKNKRNTTYLIETVVLSHKVPDNKVIFGVGKIKKAMTRNKRKKKIFQAYLDFSKPNRPERPFHGGRLSM